MKETVEAIIDERNDRSNHQMKEAVKAVIR